MVLDFTRVGQVSTDTVQERLDTSVLDGGAHKDGSETERGGSSLKGLSDIRGSNRSFVEEKVTESLVSLGKLFDELCTLLFSKGANAFRNFVGLNDLVTDSGSVGGVYVKRILTHPLTPSL